MQFDGTGSLSIDIDGTSVRMTSTAAGTTVSSSRHVGGRGRSTLGDRHVDGGDVPGSMVGDLHVDGGHVRLLGRVVGDVFVRTGATLEVLGQIVGDVRLRGARLVVSGTVIGDIHSGGGDVRVTGRHVGALV